MAKKVHIFSFILLNLLFLSGKAQLVDTCLFKADFNGSSDNFQILTNEKVNMYTKNNVYYLEFKENDRSYRTYNTVCLDQQKDFTIITSVYYNKGYINNFYGICFGYKDNKNASYFFIKNDGSFQIIKHDNAKKKVLVKAKTKFVKKPGEKNVLLVKKISDKLYFFINYQMVAVLPFQKFPENKYGLYVEGKMEMACDYFYIKQQKQPINLIAGYDKFGILVKLGPEINSTYSEIKPVVSADEKYLFVNRKDCKTGDKYLNDEVFYATLNADSCWKPLRSIGKTINNEQNNYICGISSDNNEIIIGGKYEASKKSSGKGFSRAYRTKDGWSDPVELKIKNYYNNDHFVEMCPSHDFKTIILAIERKDTYGERDLYFCTMLADSSWTEPKNLGANVNTFGNDVSPFLAADNKTLYFSSNGWPGYGSNDIFVTKRLDDTWKHWSEPQNLGPIINSKEWDAYYTTSASGKFAYLVSNKMDKNKADIYQVKQPESARPEPLLMVSGKVLNSKTKQPVKALVTYSVMGSNKTSGHTTSNNDGVFTIALPKGKKYIFTAHKDGFIAEHKNSDVVNMKVYKKEEIDLLLTPFEKGETVIMHNLFFVLNKYELLPESETELNRLYELLKENKKVKLEIGGHTSINKSSEKWNYDLSFNRANVVKEYMVKKGIAADRIVVKGYSNTKPVDKIQEESHQAKNRRVEFTILEK